MKKLFRVLILIALPVLVFSCLSENGKDLRDIKKMETVFVGKRDSSKLAVQLDASYRMFIRKYPEDTSIPRMLFEDAQINIYPLHKTDAAVAQLENLYTKYPQNRFSPNAMFKAAFLDENILGHIEQAKSLYALFIKTYPDNSLANDARVSLENIGLSPEQQFQKIKAAHAADSTKNKNSPAR